MPQTFPVAVFGAVDPPAHTPVASHSHHLGVPIVIDNVIFDNVMTRFKDRKTGLHHVVVGGECYSDPAARSIIRTMFDASTNNGSVVVSPEYLEHTLDYIFVQLGLGLDDSSSSQGRVDHPIVFSEPFCNPNYCRKITSEVLFEVYRVPGICYNVDFLSSFYYNTQSPNSTKVSSAASNNTGIIVSSANQATHIVPVLKGAPQPQHALRINLGGQQSVEYMLKLMQLKYPSFPSKMTLEQARHLVCNHTYVANDYVRELRAFADFRILDEKTHVIQFPFTAPQGPSQEQLETAEKRKQQNAERLRVMAAQQRLEKLNSKVELRNGLMSLKDKKNDMSVLDFKELLGNNQLRNEKELDEAIKSADSAVRRLKAKIAGEPFPSDDENERVPPTFELVDRPDEELDDEQKKEKRRQKLLKAGWEAREKARKEKLAEKERKEAAEKAEEERRLAEPEAWLQEQHEKRLAVINRIKARRKRRQQLQDRRSMASQARMRNIANLADDATSKRRRRGQDDDGFGANDEDWAVYRDIKNSDSDGEDGDLAELEALEVQLMRHDPHFTTDPDALIEGKPFKDTLLSHLRHGHRGPTDPSSTDASDLASLHSLHVNVERIRVPEVLFQPSIAGIDQAGIVECISNVLSRFDAITQERMCQNVFLTGSHIMFPGIVERLQSELVAMRPSGSGVFVHRAQDPQFDAWRGAARFASLDKENFAKATLTLDVYEECGQDYLAECALSNKFYRGAVA